jgi:hypothetical protein
MSYEIGYGKPPETTRFQKGNKYYLKRSRRKPRDVAAIIKETLETAGRISRGRPDPKSDLVRIVFSRARKAGGQWQPQKHGNGY